MHGKHHSIEARRKISLANIGNKKTLGYKHSEETKAKNRKSARRGERNNMWRGGITPLRKQIRECFKYRQWRSDVFTRDNFTCQDCNKRGGWIEAHHVLKSFADILIDNKIKTLEDAINCEEMWNINNGRTLCENCHKKTTKTFWVNQYGKSKESITKA